MKSRKTAYTLDSGLVALLAIGLGSPGCVGGASGGGGGVVVLNCTTNTECGGGTCVEGLCRGGSGDTLGGDGSSANHPDAGRLRGGIDGASSGGISDGATDTGSSKGDADCVQDSDCDDHAACTDDRCSAGKCSNPARAGACFIDGSCYPLGAHPSDPCRKCSDATPTKWEVRAGGACDDGDPCTAGDLCSASGQCKGQALGACCEQDADCTAGGPCKLRACDLQTKTCQYYPRPGCCSTDGDCSGATKPCTESFCNKALLTCDVKKLTDGAACDDGNACTTGDRCTQGDCTGTADCDDKDPCTTDFCQSGNCQHSPISDCGGQQCSSGACCDIFAGKYKPKGTKCGSSVKGTYYQCNGLKQVRKRYTYFGCSGISAICSTSSANYAFSDWIAHKSCSPTPGGSSGTACTQPTSIYATCSTEKPCTSGSCCDAYYMALKPRYSKCGTSTLKSEYKCSGKRILYRRAYYGCKGSSSSCSSSSNYYHWTGFGTYKTCPLGTVCKPGWSSSVPPSCVAGATGTPGQCGSGACCNTSLGLHKPKGEKCSSTATKYEYKCSSTGKAVYRRRLYRGCSGYSSSCSTSSANYYRSEWANFDTCAVGRHCYFSISSKKAYCTTSSAGKCSSGTCCDTSHGYYRPRYALCNSAVRSVQYKCSTDAKSVLRRYGRRGCSGHFSSCSTSSTDYNWSNWTPYKTCGSGQYCKQVSANSAGCYSP